MTIAKFILTESAKRRWIVTNVPHGFRIASDLPSESPQWFCVELTAYSYGANRLSYWAKTIYLGFRHWCAEQDTISV